jgi:type II secretory pathway component GspD/PulD (secretin)
MAATGNTRGWPIKTGNKIPLHTGEKDIQYLDTGVNIDTENAVDDGANLHLVVKVEVSSLAPEQNTTAADPVIRQNEWGAEVRLPVGKPTVIFSSDNLENKGRTEVELTATRIE